MGTLYVVATPIGNLQDITIRALKVLGKVDVIACEDTRRTGLLLKSLRETYPASFSEQKQTKLMSYFDQTELRRVPEVIRMLQSNLDIALVSDAGTPLISDPGYRMVNACLMAGVHVEPIPGSSSVITALSVSGMPTDKFLFLGYPPQKQGHRKTFFADIVRSWTVFKTTVVLFVAPHKLKKTLAEMQEELGDIRVVLMREMTKLHEERQEENISELLKIYDKLDPKGEYVILLSPHVSAV